MVAQGETLDRFKVLVITWYDMDMYWLNPELYVHKE